MPIRIVPPPTDDFALAPWITPGSRASLGLTKRSMTASSDASTAWGTANLALYIPFIAPASFWVLRIGWLNGTTVAGNVDAGILDANGVKLLSTGSTAQATVSVIQVVDVTDTQFSAGRYYLALSASDATATFMATPITSALRGRWAGCAQEASAVPLPATATMATFAAAFIPYFGLCQRDTA